MARRSFYGELEFLPPFSPLNGRIPRVAADDARPAQGHRPLFGERHMKKLTSLAALLLVAATAAAQQPSAQQQPAQKPAAQQPTAQQPAPAQAAPGDKPQSL